MIEKKEQEQPKLQEPNNWLNDFVKSSTPDPKTFGYIKLPVPEEEKEPDGNVYLAHLRQENSIGSMLNRKTTFQLSDEEKKDYRFIDYVSSIPRDLIPYADRFYGARSHEDFASVESELRNELKDKSLLDAHPIKALAYAFDPLEPTNWLPGGAIYKEAKLGSSIARSFISGGLYTAGAVATQETILQQNQLTRTMQESIHNTIFAGLLGGVIGGGLSAFGSRALAKEDLAAVKAIESNIKDVITPGESVGAARSAVKDGAELANMSNFKGHQAIHAAMKITPMNRLLLSPFKTAKWFGSYVFEHSLELEKNKLGIASDISIEKSIKTELRKLNKVQINHMNHYYDMHGIDGSVLKGTRKKIKDLTSTDTIDINVDQFNRAVYESALTGIDHKIPQITAAAKMWRTEFDRIKNRAIELNLLAEDVDVPNAVNYIMIMYNKNKIIEEGGKSARNEGTFARHVYDNFVKSNEAVKQYLESPIASIHLKKIEGAKIELDVHTTTLKRDLNPKIMMLSKDMKKLVSDKVKSHPSAHPNFDKRIKKLQKEIDTLREKSFKIKAARKPLEKAIEDLNKLLNDGAPKEAKDWEGNLHAVIKGDDEEHTAQMIWGQVENTIDHILGDSDGQLLNPFMQKMGGKTKPFKGRKLLIDQLEASPWHITDIQKIAEAHHRAMVPAIELQQFAKDQGYADVDSLLVGITADLRKEMDAALEGVTGKKAQKIRDEYERNINDMKAAIQMMQGVYGQGFNVLNSSASEFFENIMKWNYTRMLGGMTLSALPEAARLVMKNSPIDVLVHGIGSMFSTVKKISKNDAQAIGYAIETQQATLFKSYIEHSGLSTNPSPFTKGLDSLTRNFGNLSLMNPWTDMVQGMAAHIAINKILRIVHLSVDGKKVSQKSITNLARLGIGQEHFKEIAKFTKGNVHKGTRFADWANWDIKTRPEANALRVMQAAVAKSIDEITIVPSFGDKPLVLQQKGVYGRIARMMMEFKSYFFAATNRILYSSIQNRNDINTYLGIASMMGLGALSYIASSVARGDDPDLSAKNLLKEGLDRSAVLGIFGEGINIGRKMFRLGDVSRYQSRDAFGSTLGPTGGTLNEMKDLFNDLLNPFTDTQRPMTTKDVDVIMKLMPLQNLFYFRRILRSMMHEGAQSMGVLPVNND